MNFSFDVDKYIQKLEQYSEGRIQYVRDCPLSSLTTFKIGGPCAVAVLCESVQEIVYAIECATDTGAKVKVIGRGSNLLCSDDGYDGVIICCEGADRVHVMDDIIECECGLSLTALSNEAYEAGLTGAEFMYGIPGTVGGGVFMNAGAYGGEMSDVVIRVECMNIKTKQKFVLMREELDLSYRHSIFSSHPEYIVLSVMIRLSRGNREEIHEKMRDYISRRREKQPLEFPSAGSTFKRGEGYYASQLIDQTGLKGMSVGGAQVSEKHAGFVINCGGATARDVLDLIEKVKDEVEKAHGVRMECEVEYLG